MRLLATFLTPLVVLLIDMLDRTGWHLAEDRLIDTLLGCAIALVIGFAPWPGTWQAHLSDQFAEAVTHVARYTERALAGPSPERSRLRRQTYRELSDLRTEFQRSMSQPRALGRQATAWWPAVAGLEQVMDTVTRAAVAVDHGAPAPSADDVRQLTARSIGSPARCATAPGRRPGRTCWARRTWRRTRRWPRWPTRSAACRPSSPRLPDARRPGR